MAPSAHLYTQILRLYPSSQGFGFRVLSLKPYSMLVKSSTLSTRIILSGHFFGQGPGHTPPASRSGPEGPSECCSSGLQARCIGLGLKGFQSLGGPGLTRAHGVLAAVLLNCELWGTGGMGRRFFAYTIRPKTCSQGTQTSLHEAPASANCPRQP